MLVMDEQNRMLRRGWTAAFILRAAIWPIDLSNFRKTDRTSNLAVIAADDALTAARSTISELRLDRIEISILETLALCRPGKPFTNHANTRDDRTLCVSFFSLGNLEVASTKNAFRVMSRAMDTAVETLVRHLDGRGRAERSARLVKIMLVLPILTACCPRELAGDLFAPIIGDVDLERVIASVR